MTTMTDSVAQTPPAAAVTSIRPSVVDSSTMAQQATAAVAAATSYWDEHGNLNNKERTPLVTAANLIAALDTAYADMNSLAASAAREVETARRNAREASEVARRYRARSYPKESLFVGNGHPHISPSSSIRRNDSQDEGSEDHQTPQNGSTMPTTPPIGSGTVKTTTTNGNGPSDWGVFSPTEQQGYEAHNAPSATASAGSYLRKRKTFKLRSSPSVEQLAQSHAEDVLSLSLELERAKLALQSEQTAHMKTKSALAEANKKNTQLEAQIQKLLGDMETHREDHGRKVDLLEDNLERAKLRVQAAEEDAQEALDLAKGFAEHRDELEDSLQRALQELHMVRGSAPENALPTTGGPSSDSNIQQHRSSKVPRPHPPPPPKGPPSHRSGSEKKGVRFADQASGMDSFIARKVTPTTLAPSNPPDKSQSPRSMVAAGRQVLQRIASTTTPGESMDIPSSNQLAVVINPQRSAERRNRLRERLQAAGSDIIISSPPSKPPRNSVPPSPASPPFDNKHRESCQQVASLLRESAHRIGLTGHWWTTTTSSSSPSKPVEEVEQMTRSFCQSVEVKLDRQTNDVKELQSLINYLEDHLATRNYETV